MNHILLSVWAIALLLSGCAAPQAEGIEVRDAWIRPAAQGGNGAIYFVIENHSSETHEMIGAASESAAAVEMHESSMSGDVMQMHQVEAVSLGPGSEVTFEPGGLHIMLIDLTEDLETGDEIEVTLQFTTFEDLTIPVPVQEASTNEESH